MQTKTISRYLPRYIADLNRQDGRSSGRSLLTTRSTMAAVGLSGYVEMLEEISIKYGTLLQTSVLVSDRLNRERLTSTAHQRECSLASLSTANAFLREK